MPAEAVSANQIAIDAAYLVTGICFILGLKFLSHPQTARNGNRISMLGMAVALVATGFLLDWSSAWWIVAIGGGGGALVGIYSARAVKMTAMPQMVALFNGAGGGAAAMVAAAEFLHLNPGGSALSWDQSLPIILSSVIGAISFTGSIIERFSEQFVIADAGGAHQLAVAARNQQRDKRELRCRLHHQRRQQMAFEMVYTEHRHAERVGKTVRDAGADQ